MLPTAVLPAIQHLVTEDEEPQAEQERQRAERLAAWLRQAGIDPDQG